MKKLWCLLGLVLLLTGCGSVQTWECVRDTLPVQTVACWQEQYGDVLVELPDCAQAVEQSVGRSRYRIGELEIETRLFLASDRDSAVRQISGLPPDQLTILELDRGEEKAFQVCWYDAEREELCRAAILLEDQQACAAICRRPERVGEAYDDQIRAILSSLRHSPTVDV